MDGRVKVEMLAELQIVEGRIKELGRRGRDERVRLGERAAALHEELARIAYDECEEAMFNARIEACVSKSRAARVTQAQARRVKGLLDRDRADGAAERFRREAEIEFDAGKTVMMADAVVPPTPEQLASGEFLPHYPRQPDGSVREVRTHRRIAAYQAHRMMLWGVIDRSGYRDCAWYAELHYRTGLAGSVKSIDYGREVFSPPHTRSVFTDRQVENQDTFRFIRRNIRLRHLRLLDQVVLFDSPIFSAVRTARAFHRNPKPAFAEAVHQLGSARRLLAAD